MRGPGWSTTTCWRPIRRTARRRPRTGPRMYARACGRCLFTTRRSGADPGAASRRCADRRRGAARAAMAPDAARCCCRPPATTVRARLVELLLIDSRRPARRHLGTAQGLRERRMPVGVLRQVPQPRRHLVRDVVVRQQTQEPRVPRAQGEGPHVSQLRTGATPALRPARPARSATSAARSARSGCRCGGAAR